MPVITQNKEFAVNVLNDLGLSKLEEISIAFDILLSKLIYICPPNRELSVVKTKLEEACFFAKKSASFKDEYIKQENKSA